jgi:acyl-coenzyme A thioesterase PaaI-like protein
MDNLKQMLTAMVPFIRTVGIDIDHIERGRAMATLGERKAVQNHLGTAHAGAVYTLGESASGGVVMSLFADLFPAVFIALKSSSVRHLKALPGPVKAVAVLDGEADSVRATYDATGKVDFDVRVSLKVGDTETAVVVYTWAARAPRS